MFRIVGRESRGAILYRGSYANDTVASKRSSRCGWATNSEVRPHIETPSCRTDKEVATRVGIERPIPLGYRTTGQGRWGSPAQGLLDTSGQMAQGRNPLAY